MQNTQIPFQNPRDHFEEIANARFEERQSQLDRLDDKQNSAPECKKEQPTQTT